MWLCHIERPRTPPGGDRRPGFRVKRLWMTHYAQVEVADPLPRVRARRVGAIALETTPVMLHSEVHTRPPHPRTGLHVSMKGPSR